VRRIDNARSSSSATHSSARRHRRSASGDRGRILAAARPLRRRRPDGRRGAVRRQRTRTRLPHAPHPSRHVVHQRVEVGQG